MACASLTCGHLLVVGPSFPPNSSTLNAPNPITTFSSYNGKRGAGFVSNGARIHCMKTWNPINNKKFETLSYLPPLSQLSIAKEIDYIINKGWIPCIEFNEVGYVYRENSRIPNYYDGRFWTLWKLPMFNCMKSSDILKEIDECKKTYPSAYVRCVAFDNKRKAQCMAFLVRNPHEDVEGRDSQKHPMSHAIM